MNRCTDQIRPTSSSFFNVCFYHPQAKNGFYISQWFYLKNDLFWDMKTLWNSVSSVHRNSVAEIQPCLIVCVLSAAAFMLRWQRWTGETTCPANLIDLLTGSLQKKFCQLLSEALFEKLQWTTSLYKWSPRSWSSPGRDHKPIYSSLLSPSLCHLHNFNSQFSSHTVLILFSQTALFLFLPLL